MYNFFMLTLLLFSPSYSALSYVDGQTVSVGIANPVGLTYRAPDKAYAKIGYIDPSRTEAIHRIDQNTLKIVAQDKFHGDELYARMAASEHGGAKLLDYWATEKDNKLYVLMEMESFFSSDDPNLLKQYYDLFLDPFEKMVLNGANVDAIAFIDSRLREITRHKLERHDINTALLTLEQNKLQEQRNLAIGEKFSPFWFRQFDIDIKNLILPHQNNIGSLTKEEESRRLQIQTLEASFSALDDYDKKSLESMRKSLPDFTRDTKSQIALEQARIDFINHYPDLFRIIPRPRYEILGMAPLDLWKEAVYYNRKKLGDGIIVGIVDSFDACTQDSAILAKAINPQFIGHGCAYNTHRSHGLHVAGIVVSNRFPKQQTPLKDITIGIAPNARFEMFSYQTFEALQKTSIKTSSLVPKEQRKQWTPEAMSEAIDALYMTGFVSIENHGANQDVNLSFYEDNPIVKSKAQILNFSMGMSGYEPAASFSALKQLPVLINTIKKGKLWVIAAGNDGADLSSRALENRMIKALTLNSKTKSHVLMVTNLMEDGLTLKPSSNIPGADVSLQNRTLSAPGTNIRSTILTNQNKKDDDGFDYMSGTSMAAPHVTAIAAIVLSNYPKLSAEQLSDCLLKGATPIFVTNDGTPYLGDEITPKDKARGRELYGMGRLNLFGALEQAHLLYPEGPRWYF